VAKLGVMGRKGNYVDFEYVCHVLSWYLKLQVHKNFNGTDIDVSKIDPLLLK
jgi:hypothetical protein